MSKNITKTYEEFTGHKSIIKNSDFSTMRNWDPKRIVNKNKFGKEPYVLGDQRVSDLESKIEDNLERKGSSDELIELKREITILKKDTKNVVRQWVYKEYPSANDQVLYLTNDELKELNSLLSKKIEYDNLYRIYLNGVKPHTDPSMYRSKNEL